MESPHQARQLPGRGLGVIGQAEADAIQLGQGLMEGAVLHPLLGEDPLKTAHAGVPHQIECRLPAPPLAQLPDDVAAVEQHHAPAQHPEPGALILPLTELADAVIDEGFKLALALPGPGGQLIDEVAAQGADEAAALAPVRAGSEDLERQSRHHDPQHLADAVVDEGLIVVARRVGDGEEGAEQHYELAPERRRRGALQLDQLHGDERGEQQGAEQPEVVDADHQAELDREADQAQQQDGLQHGLGPLGRRRGGRIEHAADGEQGQGRGARLPLGVDPEGAAQHHAEEGATAVVGRLDAVVVTGERAVVRRRGPLLAVIGRQPAEPALALQIAPAEMAQAQPEGAAAKITARLGHEGSQQAGDAVFVAIGLAQRADHRGQQGCQPVRQLRPVLQHAAHPGDQADHPQLAVQQEVEQPVVAAQPVVTPHRLNAQHVHGEDLADDPLVGTAHIGPRLPQPEQLGVLPQPGLTLAKGRQQCLSIREARQNHHHQTAAEDAHYHLAHPGLGDVEDVLRLGHVDAGEGDDGRGVARQGEGVGDVVLIVVGDVGAEPQPERDKEAEQPGIADAKTGDHHGRHGADEAAHYPPQALADDAADGGKAHHGGRGHGPVGSIQLQHEGQPERQAHGQAVAQGIAPLALIGLAPGCLAPASPACHPIPLW
ncbi:hypothetical protein D3C87_835980 [compost metagenome]